MTPADIQLFALNYKGTTGEMPSLELVISPALFGLSALIIVIWQVV